LQFLVCVHRSAEQVHAMKKKNALIRIIYIWLHPVICYVLLVATNALVQLATAVAGHDNGSVDSNDRLRHTVSIGLCSVVLIMVLMRVQHKGVVDHLRTTGRQIHVVFKICVAFTHLSLYWMVQDNLYFILANSFLCTFTNVVEMAIPMFTQSHAVDILFMRTTVDAAKAPGAQKELNANRKSVLALQAERSSSPGGSSHGTSKSGRNSPTPLTSGVSGHAVELQPQHSARHDASPVIRNALHATSHTVAHSQHDRHSQHPHGSQSAHLQPQESHRSASLVGASGHDTDKQFAAVAPGAEANGTGDHGGRHDTESATSSHDAEDIA
jgi:hypothetical protein